MSGVGHNGLPVNLYFLTGGWMMQYIVLSRLLWMVLAFLFHYFLNCPSSKEETSNPLCPARDPFNPRQPLTTP